MSLLQRVTPYISSLLKEHSQGLTFRELEKKICEIEGRTLSVEFELAMGLGLKIKDTKDNNSEGIFKHCTDGLKGDAHDWRYLIKPFTKWEFNDGKYYLLNQRNVKKIARQDFLKTAYETYTRQIAEHARIQGMTNTEFLRMHALGIAQLKSTMDDYGPFR